MPLHGPLGATPLGHGGVETFFMDVRIPDAPPPFAGSDADPDDFHAVLSSLSHELCRPLISLRAGFDLLLSDPGRPIAHGQRAHVHTMAGLCDEMLKLTRSYLEYAGLVEGSQPLSFGEFTVGALVGEIDRQFGPVAESRGLRWSCGLDGPDGKVSTDATRCQQVFHNLVANALEHANEGGSVRVAASCHCAEWRFQVYDDGPGIPPEVVTAVFSPDEPMSRDGATKVEGKGLGLAICRVLVRQLGGEIRLESEQRTGTCVFLTFPVDGQNRTMPLTTA